MNPELLILLCMASLLAHLEYPYATFSCNCPLSEQVRLNLVVVLSPGQARYKHIRQIKETFGSTGRSWRNAKTRGPYGRWRPRILRDRVATLLMPCRDPTCPKGHHREPRPYQSTYGCIQYA